MKNFCGGFIVACFVMFAALLAREGWAEKTHPSANPATYQVESGPRKWPPAFPRPGATKVFENNKVIVWDEILTSTEEHMHKHILDAICIYVQDGAIKATDANGKVTIRPVGTSYPGQVIPHVSAYVTAGLGPHSEAAADPPHPRRVFWIELKGTEPPDCKDWSTACQ
jgi:hypothetical protein